MLNRHLSYCILLMAYLHVSFAFANDAGDSVASQIKQEVMHAFNGLVEASTELNVEQYFSYIDHERFVGLNADGSNWTSADALRKTVVPGFSLVRQVDSLTFTSVTISVIDAHTAVLVNEFEQQATMQNGNTVMFAGGGAQVWSKAGGSWKLVSISASTKPPVR